MTMSDFDAGLFLGTMATVLDQNGFKTDVFDTGVIEFTHPDLEDDGVNVLALNPNPADGAFIFEDEDVSLIRSLLATVGRCDEAYRFAERLEKYFGEQSQDDILRFKVVPYGDEGMLVERNG